MKNSTSVGITDKKLTANRLLQLMAIPTEFLKLNKPSGKVKCSSGAVKNTKGQKKSFHALCILMIVTVKIAGFARGKYIL